jgi:hypothetical protein
MAGGAHLPCDLLRLAGILRPDAAGDNDERA